MITTGSCPRLKHDLDRAGNLSLERLVRRRGVGERQPMNGNSSTPSGSSSAEGHDVAAPALHIGLTHPELDLLVEQRHHPHRIGHAAVCGTAALSAYLTRLALCVEPALAHPAAAAGDLEGHDHPITGTDLSDVPTDLEHDADRLVAQYVTHAHEGAHGLIQVEIGPADVGTGDLDDRVVRLLDHRVGDLFY
jgi:hypothetical protein